MRIKEGFILRKIANTDMVVPIGNNIADFNGIISLNGTAAFLWRILKEGSNLPVMVELLTKYYNVSREVAQLDAQEFVMQLKDADILEYDTSEGLM